MDEVVKAGISGFAIAVGIIFFSPVNTYFLPYLVASVIVIYAFELKETKDGVLVAFIIYIFTEWILGSLNLTVLLISNETINFTVDIWMVMNQMLTTLFILLAGLLTPDLARMKWRTATAVPPIPEPIPVPPSPSVTVAISEEKKFCRHCGAENKTDAVFCEKCGRRIG